MKYFNGIEIKVGDTVLYNFGNSKEIGIVTDVVQPGTSDAQDFSLPNGGVVIQGGALGLFSTDYIENDEEIQFVSRASEAESEDS
jgi:hypothetical protein